MFPSQGYDDRRANELPTRRQRSRLWTLKMVVAKCSHLRIGNLNPRLIIFTCSLLKHRFPDVAWAVHHFPRQSRANFLVQPFSSARTFSSKTSSSKGLDRNSFFFQAEDGIRVA